MTTAIVTTSWDDGHPCDLRVLELLERHGLRGTFYVAMNGARGPEIDRRGLRALAEAGMEIGSHGHAHRRLTRMRPADAAADLDRSRRELEDLLGFEVRSVSYPEGAFNHGVLAAARRAGYRVGRTTMEFSIASRFDPLRMPISVELTPRSRRALVRHALRDGNVSGLAAWARRARLDDDVFAIAEAMFDVVLRRGGVFHVSARSWQIEEAGLWGRLERLLAHVAGRPGVAYAVSADLVKPRPGSRVAPA